jgi:hypothetical protein
MSQRRRSNLGGGDRDCHTLFGCFQPQPDKSGDYKADVSPIGLVSEVFELYLGAT